MRRRFIFNAFSHILGAARRVQVLFLGWEEHLFACHEFNASASTRAAFRAPAQDAPSIGKRSI